MKKFVKSALIGGLIGLMSFTAAQAKNAITYDGRDAQLLHCAALHGIAAQVLQAAGEADQDDLAFAQFYAFMLLRKLPGTEKQQVQAYTQRMQKIMKTRSLGDFIDEYDETSKWCIREFVRNGDDRP
ncbi:hypothetical protein [Thioclava sp. SK-1]|uniref:hypothetical protein n=1 Tax=Thioclava sp. SK-1 TaxID=1889770 RepID=UPI00114D04FF|nr:hypothetical protein [Thioclava sp. SK-1]